MLPSSIQAIFYLRTDRCKASQLCEARARLVHELFAREFATDNVPLLELDPYDFRRPFRVAAAARTDRDRASARAKDASAQAASLAEAVARARSELARVTSGR